MTGSFMGMACMSLGVRRRLLTDRSAIVLAPTTSSSGDRCDRSLTCRSFMASFLVTS
jgi:hypothetical protein